MKKSILSIVLSVFIFSVSFANPLSKEKVVVAYIDNSMHNHHDQNLSLYDESMLSFITTDEIKANWEAAIKENGAFVSIQEMKNESKGAFEQTSVLCKFEKKSIVFKFTFDKEGNLKSVVRSSAETL